MSLRIDLSCLARTPSPLGSSPRGQLKGVRSPSGGYFRFKRRLGEGSEGEVYLAEARNGGLSAVKVVSGDAYERHRQMKGLWQTLRHPNIVRVTHVMWERGARKAYLGMELCEGGDLHQRTTSTPNRRLQETEAADIMRQVLSALSYCHLNGISHGDVKPENILTKSNGVAKLADFGSVSVSRHGSHGPGLASSGTRSYMAPELCNSSLRNHNPMAADMWSFGVTLYTITAGHTPWSVASQQDQSFRSWAGATGEAHHFPQHFSEELRDVLRQLLQLDPQRRPTADQLASHPFFLTLEEALQTSSPGIQSNGSGSPYAFSLSPASSQSPQRSSFKRTWSDLNCEGSEEEADRSGRGRESKERV